MRANFADIARLCAECQSLIDCHDKIAVLSEVHYNLRKTLQVGGWEQEGRAVPGAHGLVCEPLPGARSKLGTHSTGEPSRQYC